MRNLKILISICVFLLGFQEVYALAISQPIPTNMTLKVGESLPFRFEIQAINSNEDLLCIYSINGLKPLKTIFNENKSVVKAGEVAQVLGTLEIPLNSPVKEYNGNLAVICSPTTDVTGSVITQTMSVSFKVNVVKVEESDKGSIELFLILVGIAILFFIFDVNFKRSFSKAKKNRRGRKRKTI